MILAGDVGGTKVHLALYNFADGKLSNSARRSFLPPSTLALTMS